MRFVCELVPVAFLTPFRRALARELSSLGYVQTRIAEILGVSQPVVSSYLSTDSPSPAIFKQAIEELVENLVVDIKAETLTPLELMTTTCEVCQKMRSAGPLCDVHRKQGNLDFPVGCDLCFPSQELSLTFSKNLQATIELYEAAQLLIGAGRKFGDLIPEIGCQFIYTVNKESIGFPGRIVRVKRQGRIVSPPEIGQGPTLAKILLFFQKHGSSFQSLISLRSKGKILDKVSDMVIERTVEGDKDWDGTLGRIPKEEVPAIHGIADTGGIGLEPILYLFGQTPAKLASLIFERFCKD
ncbi:MAG: thiamine-phosphate synthase family protein [Candidatus Heimdallarchaeota archaeon]